MNRYLTGRGRRHVQVRLAAALVGTTGIGLALALSPRSDLHAPVVEVIAAEAPALPSENLTAIFAAEPIFEPVDAALVGLEPGRLHAAEEAVRSEVRRGAFPGAALVVGRGGSVVSKSGIGRLSPGGPEVDPATTVYDLASLTKVVATTSAVMLLVEDGRMELDAPVSRYLPEFTGGSKARVTVRHLLTHTSGLPAGIGAPGGSSQAVLRRVIATPLRWAPGERVEYSDLGPIVLFAAAERAAGEPLDEMLQRRVFGPLGMHSTRFLPEAPCNRCAPTTATIHGRVHDPLAHRLGGIAGHAGLFSTASDLGRFAAMLAGGGELEGVRILQEETVREFTARQPRAGTRALGWDTPNARGVGPAGTRISRHAFGHTGFTGTSLWVDPDRGTWTVLLTNRTFSPRVPNRIQALRRTIHDQVSNAADLAAE